MFGFSSFAEAPFASLAVKVLLATASVNSFANVTCNANTINSGFATITATGSANASALRQRLSSAQISGITSVNASPNAIYSGNGSINTLTTVTGYANANYSAYGAINCNANLTANSFTNTWENVVVSGNTWNDVAVNANIWSDVAVSTNTWGNYDNNLYVDIDYWVSGYVVDVVATWTDVTTNSNTWYRQG